MIEIAVLICVFRDWRSKTCNPFRISGDPFEHAAGSATSDVTMSRIPFYTRADYVQALSSESTH